jgi:hypothetical protein
MAREERMMTLSTKRLACGGLLAAGLLVVASCERGPGRPPIDTTQLVGNWIELADQAAVNPRARVADEEKKKDYRYIAFKNDNTFEFSVRTESGEPTKDKGQIEGTWAITTENTITFTVTNNTFADGSERRDWAPEFSAGISQKEAPGRGTIQALTIVDVEGGATAFTRAK